MKMFIIGIVIGLVWMIINFILAKNETLRHYRDICKPLEWIILGIMFFFSWRMALGILTFYFAVALVVGVIMWREKRETAGY